MKPALQVVRQPAAAPAAPYDETKGLKRIEMLRTQLLAACVKYAKDGTSGKLPERVNMASDLSGIPRLRIESEAKR